MKHNYSEIVKFDYDRKKLLAIVHEIIETDDLMKRSVPISSFRKEHKLLILEALSLQYDHVLFDICVRHITIACLKPNQTSAIHIDRNEKNEPITKALNLPLSFCDKVFMRWYKKKDHAQEKNIRSAQGFSIPGLRYEDAITVHTQRCDKPFLVNPSFFHDITNVGSNNEFIISVRTGVKTHGAGNEI